MTARPVVALMITALALLTPSCASPATTAPSPSNPNGGPCGPSTVNGVPVMTWCGSGSVTIARAGTELTLSQAVCDRTMGPNELAVSAGSTVRSPSDAARVPEATGFSLFISGAPAGRDGMFRQVVFGGNEGGAAFVADQPGTAQAELTAGGTAGTFEGVDDSGKNVTGTFTCG